MRDVNYTQTKITSIFRHKHTTSTMDAAFDCITPLSSLWSNKSQKEVSLYLPNGRLLSPASTWMTLSNNKKSFSFTLKEDRKLLTI